MTFNFNDLSESDVDGIIELLFQSNVLSLEESKDLKKAKAESFFKLLPKEIILDGFKWGFNDTEVMDNMCVFLQNRNNEI